MVVRDNHSALVSALREWSKALDGSGVTLSETLRSPAEYVYELTCAPPSSDMSSLSLGIGLDGTCGIMCGTGLFLSDLDLEPSELLELCDSVKEGRVVEERVENGGVLIYATGRLDIDGTRTLVLLGHTRSFRWIWHRLTGGLRRRTVHYRPWPKMRT